MLSLGLDKYRKYLSDADLSDAAKDALLRAIWRIAEESVDVAWGQDSQKA
jgi:hypothetical protein